MKTHPVFERGQALVFIALAIVGLVGITGLAIDGSMVLADRRHAQNAADTSALTGALTYIKACQVTGCNETSEILSAEAAMEIDARNRADDNGYTGDLISSSVEINRPPMNGPYAGDSEYLQVVIYSTVPTTFARVLGVYELHNRVEAVALLQEEGWDGIFGGNALVELKPTSANCSGDFVFGGSATVTLDGGGVYVNSDNDVCAFQCSGSGTSGTLNIINGGNFSIVGDPGYKLDNCSGGINPSDITSGAKPFPFPPELVLDEPPECSTPPSAPIPVDATTVRLYPGSYTNLPPNGNFMGVNLNNYSNLILDPGNYCVSRVLKDFGNTTIMTGSDVFIYIQNGGDFNITGGSVQIDAPSDPIDPYKGYLIYVDPGPIDPVTKTYSGSPADCTITGNGNHKFTGAIYAPYCSVTVNGDSGPEGIRAQIIAYELKLNGNNALYFLYNESDMPQEYIPPATGIAN